VAANRPGWTRVVIWVVAGGFGVFLIVTGIIGILTKAR
jgi:hypothetical protein